ncbi:hypothetical protein LUX34_00695 [Streptomyces werraensis]|nr:hypothetical protein [Streptomyces werraensis]
MTAHHRAPKPPPGRDTTVVLDLGFAPHDDPALEVLGPLDGDRLEAALDQVAVHHPDAPARPHRVEGHGPARHTLRLSPGRPAPPSPGACSPTCSPTRRPAPAPPGPCRPPHSSANCSPTPTPTPAGTWSA